MRGIKQQLVSNTVWTPIPNTSQEFALDSRSHVTFYTGARGPGKTDTQLMRFKKRVGMGYGFFWRGVIFDREYKNLDDIVSKSRRWFGSLNDGGKFLESAKDYKWVWPSGEELLFRSIKRESEYWNYHGHELPYIGWNEITKYPNLKLYDMMMSCNRSSFTPEKDTPDKPLYIYDAQGKVVRCVHDKAKGILLPPIPLEIFPTGNPYGPGHGAVKRKFIDVAPYGHEVATVTNVFDPKTKERIDVRKTQVTIFGSYRENIYLSPEYVAELENIKDPNKKKAWLEGDWNIVAGGAFDDLWNEQVHILPRFKIPKGWRVDRCFDWGSTHPFYVGWFAEANGEEATLPNGEKFCPVSGSLILLYEWYGTKELGSNEGLALSAPSIADGIIEREITLMLDNWVPEQPVPGPADNQISNVREKDVDTIEKKMADKGVRWTTSDKSPGSRKNGLQLMRDRLEAAVKGEGEALYFMDNCRNMISILPTLPRDEDDMDDVDTEAEDHPYDAARYRVLKGSNRFATRINVSFPS